MPVIWARQSQYAWKLSTAIANGTGTNRGPQTSDEMTVIAIRAGTVSSVRLRIALFRLADMRGGSSARSIASGGFSAIVRASPPYATGSDHIETGGSYSC